jgi:5-methylcytosine-specific restriction enzyme subunit McrC
VRNLEPKRFLLLREWEPTEVELTPGELSELQELGAAKLVISPGRESRRYVVKPTSVVGSAATPRLQLVIEPKVGIDRVFFLLGYARKVPHLRESVSLGSQSDLVEAFVIAFLTMLQQAMRRGLLMGYVEREEALPLVRGRIRFADQVRRRYGLPLPVELAYDDYTFDTEPNRLLKAALRRLAYVRFRQPALRSRVNEALAGFAAVSDVAYNRRKLPAFTYTRLNERYRAPLELARLVLQNASVELEEGRTPMTGILFDMNDVFEDFVFAAVGDELRRLVPSTYRWRHGKRVALDVERRVQPEPDMSLWDGASCVFVGDAKYKTTTRGEVDDLYQVLAYCASTGLNDALLLYAEVENPVTHQVVRGGPQLHVDSIDLALPTEALKNRCRVVAERIAALAVREAVA